MNGDISAREVIVGGTLTGTVYATERVELQPIDPQLNGPQLFYGLRYHIHIVKPGEVFGEMAVSRSELSSTPRSTSGVGAPPRGAEPPSPP